MPHSAKRFCRYFTAHTALRLARALAWLLPCLAVSACSLAQLANREAYARYHASRMQLVAAAYLDGRETPAWDTGESVPLLCEPEVEPAYHALAAAAWAERQAEAALAAQTGHATQVLEGLVGALAARDGQGAAHFAPLAAELAPELQRLEQARLSAQAALTHAESALGVAWQALPDAAGIAVSLSAAVETARAGLPAPPAEQQAVVQHYHDAVYTRLAAAYCGYSPPAPPDPAPPVPPDAAALEALLARYEVALRVRYDLDQALAANVAQMDELVAAKLAPADWERAAVSTKPGGSPRAAVVLARLKVLKLASGMLDICLSADAREAAWQWRKLWPQVELAGDVAAFAAARRAGAKDAADGAVAAAGGAEQGEEGTQAGAEDTATDAPGADPPADETPFTGWEDYTFRK